MALISSTESRFQDRTFDTGIAEITTFNGYVSNTLVFREGKTGHRESTHWKEARASVDDRRKPRLAQGKVRRAGTAKNGVPKQNDGAAPERPDTAGAVPGDLI